MVWTLNTELQVLNDVSHPSRWSCYEATGEVLSMFVIQTNDLVSKLTGGRKEGREKGRREGKREGDLEQSNWDT